ncbi:hypothetical protein CUJ83_11490 [Methanocella sp. CWC-04]|uniref:HD domain-containing protein n=1 Tax=Methanooceanicella nereidis TaxID=2052831 RepID=A0AAP2RDI5_9EURY|nr:HDIG domain-containing metalloprotein [Methanocella sp. CWC-04]MCD1295621.1 hypothetical protein [Methanocella sp. CWC-04]
MKRFGKEEALALLKKYGISPAVMEHIMAVRDYAVEIAGDIDCDRELVEVGALLHDIGRSRSHDIDHAIIGAGILKDEGVDDRIVKIVERHIGAGLTPDEAKKLGLPPADYVPKTIEEKIVAHADNLIGNNERVSIKDTISMARRKWFASSVGRLIEFHYEVFRPEKVILTEPVCSDNGNGLDLMKKALDKKLKDMDILYRLNIDGDRYVVSLHGRDAGSAKDLLIKDMGAEPFSA